MEKEIYLDNAATTKMRKEVLDDMLPYMMDHYANASAIYDFANPSKVAIANARRQIAKVLNASSDEIYFTSGGTESNNWVIKQVSNMKKSEGKHIITSKVEHHSVELACKYLEKEGYEITYLDVDSKGRIDLSQLENSIREDTILISIMFANNEVGTIMPIKEIGRIARKHNVLFHTDAVQAFCHLDIDVKDMNIDFLSSSAHKYNGPKGVGFLYMRNGLSVLPHIHGGSQEKNLRAGTYNVPGIVGMGKAVQIASSQMESMIASITKKRDYMIDRIQREIPNIILNGCSEKRLANNISICIKGVRGIDVVNEMSKNHIYISTGSACNSTQILPSHVLLAMGVKEELALGSLRITLGDDINYDEIEYVIGELTDTIEYLRS